MALYAIGDIHGSFTALKTLFNHGTFSKKDTIILLGDYVNKGENTKSSLDFLVEKAKIYNMKFLLGNHDIAMLEARNSNSKFLEWISFGGKSTIESYNISVTKNWVSKIPKSHWKLLESCLPYYEKNDFIFVHAGLKPNVPLSKQDKFHLFWKKYVNPEPYNSSKVVICGHTSRKNGQIANFNHTICIDTFAHGGEWLSCLNVKTKEFIKTNNKGELIKGKL